MKRSHDINNCLQMIKLLSLKLSKHGRLSDLDYHRLDKCIQKMNVLFGIEVG